jgi:hypothetical protein
MSNRPFDRLRNIDLDDLIWIDKVLRIAAVVIGVLVLPLVLLVSGMAADSGTPQALHSAHRIFFLSFGTDIIGIVSAFLPVPKLPLSRVQLIGFLILRIPTYAIPASAIALIVFGLTR